MTREEEIEVLFKKFGTCGCKNGRAQEQYGGDPDWKERKPQGRFSVCGVEAGDLGIEISEGEDS